MPPATVKKPRRSMCDEATSRVEPAITGASFFITSPQRNSQVPTSACALIPPGRRARHLFQSSVMHPWSTKPPPAATRQRALVRIYQHKTALRQWKLGYHILCVPGKTKRKAVTHIRCDNFSRTGKMRIIALQQRG